LNRDLPRLALGGLLLVGFVLFVTPALMVLFVSVDLPEADPVGLARFGGGCAVLLGLPGFFVLPRERRLQAVGWLALVCAGYLLLSTVLLFVLTPALLASPEKRAFLEATEVAWVRFAFVEAVLLALGFVLVRKHRTAG